MKYQIKHRVTGSILFSLECGSLKICVEAAVKARADLAGADLAGADLTHANLTDADLAHANLTRADLAHANLTDANLAGANLAGADLAGADLAGADLTHANLTRANLAGADLTHADLTHADLTHANLTRADLAHANLTDANLAGANLTDANLTHANLAHAITDIPSATDEESISNLDKVREIILDNQDLLDMGHWHADDSEWQKHTCAEEAVCGTTHCLAGWLQVCSTNPKVRELQPHIAGMICAPVASKMFLRENKETLAWLRDRTYVKELKAEAK